MIKIFKIIDKSEKLFILNFMKKTKGLVYLIEDSENNMYKIGATRGKADKRMKQLQTGNCTELKIINTFETDYPYRLETMLHNKYKNLNVFNEWFSLDSDIVSSFNETCTKLNETIITLLDNPFFNKNLH